MKKTSLPLGWFWASSRSPSELQQELLWAEVDGAVLTDLLRAWGSGSPPVVPGDQHVPECDREGTRSSPSAQDTAWLSCFGGFVGQSNFFVFRGGGDQQEVGRGVPWKGW